MRIFRLVILHAALLCALLVVSATPAAAELPDVHVLSGETYPTTGEGKVEAVEVGALETELGEKLSFSGLSFTLALKELSSLGLMSATFTGVTEPRSKTSCNTSGDAAGTVKVAGEYHIVETSLFPLTANILFLFIELVVECNSGKLKVKVDSPVIGKLEKVTSGTDVTQLGLVFRCPTKGKQELKEYLNEEGKSTKGVLKMNFGLGFETGCLFSSKEIIVAFSKMSDVLF